MNYEELIERLREYNGVVECRVQHPKTGNYCISFDWHNSFNPKRNADEWLADQKKRFPEHEYSTTYVVKEVCVLSKQDEACHEAADAIESLLAENERLNHNLTSTEQTMREYQELAAKMLEEIAKYRDAPVVVWRTHPFDYGIGHKGVYASSHFKEQGDAWERKGWKVEHLIVKPGEDK